mmetsp:Transcript_59957/g.178446  ORF Transcript_59957/g.178446 Transcript_59957/m.178446 type:complete len:213 (+) Transcript_59957:936-1574(+)
MAASSGRCSPWNESAAAPPALRGPRWPLRWPPFLESQRLCQLRQPRRPLLRRASRFREPRGQHPGSSWRQRRPRCRWTCDWLRCTPPHLRAGCLPSRRPGAEGVHRSWVLGLPPLHLPRRGLRLQLWLHPRQQSPAPPARAAPPAPHAWRGCSLRRPSASRSELPLPLPLPLPRPRADRRLLAVGCRPPAAEEPWLAQPPWRLPARPRTSAA